MSAHDLMVLIAKPFNKTGNCSAVEAFKISEAADAILAAGYRKPRTADTVEELDALPNGTKLIEPHNGHIWFKRGDKWRCTCAWETDTAESWDDTSAELLDESSGNTLVVLYAPEVGEA